MWKKIIFSSWHILCPSRVRLTSPRKLWSLRFFSDISVFTFCYSSLFSMKWIQIPHSISIIHKIPLDVVPSPLVSYFSFCFLLSSQVSLMRIFIEKSFLIRLVSQRILFMVTTYAPLSLFYILCGSKFPFLPPQPSYHTVLHSPQHPTLGICSKSLTNTNNNRNNVFIASDATPPSCPIEEVFPPLSSSEGKSSLSHTSADDRRIPSITEQLTTRLRVEKKIWKHGYRLIMTLGKSRLSSFVSGTAVVGYVMINTPFSVLTMVNLYLGTLLQSFSSNTINQILEQNHDAKMTRTARRPLPMKALSTNLAWGIALGEALLGTGLLFFFVHPLSAALGFFNLLLYTSVYTPLKRISPMNTWVGAVVGAIPPLMGGIAAVAPDSLSFFFFVSEFMTSLEMEGFQFSGMDPACLLSCLLFAWQIPHFMGLSFHCRQSYEAAGFQMLAFRHPWRASFWALLFSIIMGGLTTIGPWVLGMPMEWLWYFPLAIIANAGMIYKAALFHYNPIRYCRGCFVSSYIYLAFMLVVFFVNRLQPIHHAMEYTMPYFSSMHVTPAII